MTETAQILNSDIFGMLKMWSVTMLNRGARFLGDESGNPSRKWVIQQVNLKLSTVHSSRNLIRGWGHGP